MTNPTLVSNDTPYVGFTLTSMTEALLATRGMTLDATTKRVVATATEQAEAERRIRRAYGLLSTRFPSVWSLQEYSVTWVSGDHSLALAANLRSVLYIIYNGVNVRNIKREDYLRIVKSEEAGGGFEISSDGHPLYYRITGIADADPGAGVDWRSVLRLFPTPTAPFDAKTLTVGYNARAPALATGSEALPLIDILQEWLLCKARWLWGSDEQDGAMKVEALRDIAMLEEDNRELLEGTLETPDRIRWEYPTLPNHSRDAD